MDTTLADLRKHIDTLDRELLDVIARRMHVVEKIGNHKKIHNIPPLDEKRWQEVLRSACLKARSFHVSEKFIKKLFCLIHEHSIEIEKRSTEV